jgi:hydrogenase maturation protein HypF
MAKEPRIAALSIFYEIKTASKILRNKFSTPNWRIYQKLLTKEADLMSSSVGRIFDAIASIIGLSDLNLYEGYSAILLENIAQQYIDKNGIPEPYNFDLGGSKGVDINELLINIVLDLKNKVNKGKIAAKFHLSLVSIIKHIAQHDEFTKIAFSGGVFQNALLVDLIISDLGKDFELFFHKELSPNDENISYGQIAFYEIDQRNTKKEEQLLIAHNQN